MPNPNDALAYAESIIASLREPFVVLDKSLRVRTANTAFYPPNFLWRYVHVSDHEPKDIASLGCR